MQRRTNYSCECHLRFSQSSITSCPRLMPIHNMNLAVVCYTRSQQANELWPSQWLCPYSCCCLVYRIYTLMRTRYSWGAINNILVDFLCIYHIQYQKIVSNNNFVIQTIDALLIRIR